MSDEYKNEADAGERERRSSERESGENWGASIEYGPRFSHDGSYGAAKVGLDRRVIALFVAIAVLLTALAGIGGVFLGKYIAAQRDDASAKPDGSASGGGAHTSDSVVMYETKENAGIAEKSVAAVAAKSASSVVEIMTEASSNRYPSQTVSGAGSGVIISESKTKDYTYIVTNNHVVEGYDTILVRTTAGAEYSATVVGTDWMTDIAVLRIETKGLALATVVSSEEPVVLGQSVVAIGNPLGALGGSVSGGIISGLSRTISIDGVPMTLLQTDAAINPGNSGGGLFDMNGNLIGIVNAKSVGENVDNIGFAIPVKTAISAVSEIIEKGYVGGRADFGFSFTTATTSSGLTIYSYAYNEEVTTPIESGYVLYSITVGSEVYTLNSIENYRSLLSSLKIGDVVQAKIYKPVGQGIWTEYSPFTVNLTVHEYVG